jgi:hypothetical protein
VSTRWICDVPATYQVTFRGQFQPNLAALFGDLTLLGSHFEGPGRITTIRVSLPDEAALMGLLMHLYDQGNLLISVGRMNQPEI